MVELFDIDFLDQADPFEIDTQAAHLFKHPPLGVDDVFEVWQSDPIFYPAKPPAHWLMVAEIEGKVLMVALAPPNSGNPTRCRPHRLLLRIQIFSRPIPKGQMIMDRNEEHEFYDKPENQKPRGKPRRRKNRLTELVPVRFEPDTLEQIRNAADADDRSVSSWIRRAVEQELQAGAST